MVDQVPIAVQGKGAADGAVRPVFIGGAEDLLCRHIGEVIDTVPGLGSAACPTVVFWHPDGDVGADGVFVVQAVKLHLVQIFDPALEAAAMGVPCGSGVGGVHPGGLEDGFPELFYRFLLRAAGEDLLRPFRGRGGNDAPGVAAHVHAVIIFPAGGISGLSPGGGLSEVDAGESAGVGGVDGEEAGAFSGVVIVVGGKPGGNVLELAHGGIFVFQPGDGLVDPADTDLFCTGLIGAFGYQPDQTIIHDFSVNVAPGQKIAIVGPTGAGKTTMVKLLMRFYDVNSGSIKLDGHDVRDFNRRELRDAFGMVLQDTWLFKGTIMENIRYGRLEATDEEVIAAAKAAHADHFIKTLPGGYQMELNEDASNVSQGQKQLLTIARAILADNKILILDEATSSVDTRTEVTIQKAMDNLMRGRTSFVIAHRLSTIRNADLILVMKDGDIVEQGNHEELLEKNGFYANLYNSQFEDVVA